MKENEPFLHLGTYGEIDALIELKDSFAETDWVSYKERKITGGIASYETDTIPLLYSPYAMGSKSIQQHQHHQLFADHINRICQMAYDVYGKITEKQSMLTRLPAGKSIKRHKDKGQITRKTHRIHLPLQTNNLCIFTVGDTSMHLPIGEIWVIDNTDRFHSVQNQGNSARIHLIIDVA